MTTTVMTDNMVDMNKVKLDTTSVTISKKPPSTTRQVKDTLYKLLQDSYEYGYISHIVDMIIYNDIDVLSKGYLDTLKEVMDNLIKLEPTSAHDDIYRIISYNTNVIDVDKQRSVVTLTTVKLFR